MKSRNLGALALVGCTLSYAQTTYDINANGTWITPGTWSPASGAAGPLAADHINITGITANRTVSLPGGQTNGDTAGTYTITSLSFDHDTYTASFVGESNSGNPTLNIIGDLTKDGAASLFFQNRPSANLGISVGGNLLVSEGLLDFGVTGNHGLRVLTVAGSTTVRSGAEIRLSALATTSFGTTTIDSGGAISVRASGNRTFNFNGLSGAGALNVTNSDTSNARTHTVDFTPAAGSHQFSGAITGSAVGTGALTLAISKSGAGHQALTGAITGLNGLVTVNAGVLEFGGSSSLTTGNTHLAGGILGLGNSNLNRNLGTGAGQIRLTAAGSGFAAYGADRTVTLEGNAALSWGQTNFTPGSNLALGHSTATHKVTLTNAINLNNNARTFTVGDGAAAVDAELSGVISGTGASALVKAGDGALALTAANTYVNGTTISAGTLIADNATGSATGTGSVSLAAGATLAGGGTVSGLVTTGGATSVIRAGGITDFLTLSGGLNASAGATFDASFGTTSTRVDVGAFTGSASSGGLILNIVQSEGVQTGIAYTLFTFSSASGLDYSDLALSAQSIAAGFTLDTSYGNGGWMIDANSVRVQFSSTVIPEPSSFALLAGLAGAGMVLTRRSSRRS